MEEVTYPVEKYKIIELFNILKQINDPVVHYKHSTHDVIKDEVIENSFRLSEQAINIIKSIDKYLE